MSASARFGLFLEDLSWANHVVLACQEANLAARVETSSDALILRTALGDVLIGRSDYAPGIAIALEEAKGGYEIEYAFRIGTCGGYEPDLKVGDVIVCEGAIRGEGTSPCYVSDLAFPASPSLHAAEALLSGLESEGFKARRGLLWTTDGRIAGQYDPERISRLKSWSVAGVEMETSAFYVVSRKLGIKACSVSVVIDIPEIDKQYAEIPLEKSPAISVGLHRCFRAVPRLLSHHNLLAVEGDVWMQSHSRFLRSARQANWKEPRRFH